MVDEPNNLVLIELCEIRTKLEKLDGIEARLDRMDKRFEEMGSYACHTHGICTTGHLRSEELTARLDVLEADRKRIDADIARIAERVRSLEPRLEWTAALGMTCRPPRDARDANQAAPVVPGCGSGKSASMGTTYRHAWHEAQRAGGGAVKAVARLLGRVKSAACRSRSGPPAQAHPRGSERRELSPLAH